MSFLPGLAQIAVSHPANRPSSHGLRAGLRGRGGVSLYAPDVAIHDHSVSLERICRRAAQHLAAANVELRAVNRTRHRRSVEFAFTQRTLPVSTLTLSGVEISGDVEYGYIADLQGRARRHL